MPMSEKNIVVTSGRVGAGYRIGELLFEKADPNSFRGILHIIGERPGTMHHSYSVYITVVRGTTWAERKIDHNYTKLVSNIADTALDPREAARETITIIREMVGKRVNIRAFHANSAKMPLVSRFAQLGHLMSQKMGLSLLRRVFVSVVYIVWQLVLIRFVL